MLPLKFEDIGPEHILMLIQEGTSERKTLEYKEKLNINGNEDRAEFLADVSSFANASGGDIVFGISDQRDTDGKPTGIPHSIVPLIIGNSDSELGRISQIIETGIQPRVMGVQARVIEIPGSGPVILIRVFKSWNSPHMVTFANRSRFYSRNGIAGKVQLDVQQIGAAFAAQRSVGERLKEWKANRVGKVIASEGPISLQGPKLLFHFISAAALNDEQAWPRKFDLNALLYSVRLMSLSFENFRYNADGLLYQSKSTEGGASYLQIFRDGHLEYGDSYALEGSNFGIISAQFELKLRNTFQNALSILRQIEAKDPIFISLSLIDVKGISMQLPRLSFESSKSNPFDRQVILSPDVMVQNLQEGFPYPTTLLPILNSIWQVAGREETPYMSDWVITNNR